MIWDGNGRGFSVTPSLRHQSFGDDATKSKVLLLQMIANENVDKEGFCQHSEADLGLLQHPRWSTL